VAAEQAAGPDAARRSRIAFIDHHSTTLATQPLHVRQFSGFGESSTRASVRWCVNDELILAATAARLS